MAGKRFFNDSTSDKDLPDDLRRKRPRVSLASVVGEVVMVNSLFSSLEPLLRRVVHEEVEQVLTRCTRSITRSQSLRIQALEQSSLQLVFLNNLSLPIFTGSKILGGDGSPLQILVVDRSNGDPMVPISLPHPTKIELIVLDGDFPPRDDTWTSEQFDSSIVKERTGKRPLLHGDLTVTLRDGTAVIGDIEFTDNSSWIRSRKFRIGARLVPGTNSQGLNVREAITEAFVVKDHRGELYKKHHPPKLEDEVWRLEKIGKEGAFHKKLSSVGINTVQDFLKLSVIDTQRLRNILGVGMSERMWEVTIKHAKTCEIGHKWHIFRQRDDLSVVMNSICQVLRIETNGQVYSTREISYHFHRGYIENLVKEAYANWNMLEVVEGIIHEPALLTQGEIMDQQNPINAHQGMMIKGIEQNGHQTDDKSMISTVGCYLPSTEQMDCTDWMHVNTPFFYGTVDNSNRASNSECSSDGDFASQGL